MTIAPAAMTDLERRVLDGVTEQAWLSLACALIPAGQPEAENPLDPDQPAGREEGAALFIAGILSDLGFSVELPTKREGRPNVVASLAGEGGGKSLILNDHLDTYPAGDWAAWTMTGGHPFRPTRHGDRLYARGTSDTRGNLACTLLAARAVLAAGARLKGDLQCVYTADEEKNGPDGSIFLLDEMGLDADCVIVCEPTAWTAPDESWGMGVAVANGGNYLVEVEARGTKTHLWRPDTGVNAVAKMARLLPALETMAFAHTPAKLEGGTPPRTTILRIGGGVPREMQFTPDVCRVVLGVVGILPGMTADSVMADIDAVIADAMKADPELDASARPYPGALFVDGTLEQDGDVEPTAALRRAYARVLGAEPKLYRKNAFNDTIRFAERGKAAVTFGPGDDGWAPINESIHIGKAVAATKVLALAMLDILGVAE
ncbi:acetylornithine deacetylase [Methylopila capsulata]|uniref:Acetylornithine deacetylase n=1 Tax=Methylopila capsulata TaxID=61654 RepID=A0A9W6ITS9_9HYPH|nr:M20/M25/M40 family metallo-hydrolase [Methylopila capsulata]MBM7850215.1 acetylornithine deacetylase [Methylopila capsulata]GLK55507.1 acetylornithine deacetylase [Methylopila capsulata]